MDGHTEAFFNFISESATLWRIIALILSLGILAHDCDAHRVSTTKTGAHIHIHHVEGKCDTRAPSIVRGVY